MSPKSLSHALAASIAGAAFFTTSAQAALFVTPIDNADFEAQAAAVAPPTNFANGITDWATFRKTIAGSPTANSFVQHEDSSTDFHPLDDNGVVWGGIQSAKGTSSNPNWYTGAYQQIGTYSGNEALKVSLNYSFRDDKQWTGFTITLFTSNLSTATGGADDTLDGTDFTSLAGYQLLDSINITTQPTANAGGPNTRPSVIALSNITLNTGVSGTNGNPIWLAITSNLAPLASTSQQVYIDDVSVIPEPGSAVLALLGGMCLLPRRRR